MQVSFGSQELTRALTYMSEVYEINVSSIQTVRKQAGAVRLLGVGGRSLSRGFLCHRRKAVGPIQGVGLQRRNWRVEYAFVPGALGLEGSHRVAVGIR